MRARRVLDMAVAAVAAVVLASCSSTGPATLGPSVSVAAVGQPVTVAGPGRTSLTVTVTKVAPGWIGKPPAGPSAQYRVSFRIVNAGSVAWSGKPNACFDVVGSDGVTHALPPGLVSLPPDGRAALAPGVSGPGADTFTIPTGTTIKMVKFTIPGGQSATWTVG